LDSERRQ
jgi:hypothetical protein